MPFARHGTLAATIVTTINVGSDARDIEVLNRDGAAEIFFTVDGTEPTIEGDDMYVLPAAIGSMVVQSPGAGDTVVKLRSVGTPKYSVSVVDE